MSDSQDVRKGMPDVKLERDEFTRRFKTAFQDPAYNPLQEQIDAIAAVAWDAYHEGRKAPVTMKAGAGYHDPEYDLSVEWIAAKQAITRAQARHEDKSLPPRILIVNSSPRNDQTCPGEMSKTWRLVKLAEEEFAGKGFEVEILDLSRTVAEYGRTIHPCKACFSTSPALCHWPCSCYPNHSLGQTHDWMNDIYPMWVAAHGVMIVTPVHWYQATTPLKAMIDRLVCADGGNPDPTRTHGKHADEAKRIELEGWDYPRHLAGRIFSVVVHGDSEGAENVRRSLVDWLHSIGMQSAGYRAELDRYVGYWGDYATSHQELDTDLPFQEEVRNAALTLGEAVAKQRSEGREAEAGTDLPDPRSK